MDTTGSDISIISPNVQHRWLDSIYKSGVNGENQQKIAGFPNFSFSFSFRKSDVPELEAISQGVYILPVIILIKHARMTTVCVIAHRSDLAVN